MSRQDSRSVLIVHPADEMYGADRVLLEVVKAMPADVTLAVWLPDDIPYPDARLSRALKEMGVSVELRPLPVLRRAYLRRASDGLAMLGRLLRPLSALRTTRPSVVLVNTSACLPVAVLARCTGARVVLHLHEAWSMRERLLLAPMLWFVGPIVCVSDAVREMLPRSAQKRAQVVYNGFEDVAPTPAAAVAPGRPVHCLLASRWNGWKGHEMLLAAWAQLQRRDLRLTILGGPPPSGEFADVAALVAQLADPSSVEVVGQVDDVTGAIAAADVVLVPSVRPDPLPTIAIEAARAGRAVVASDSGGLPEIVESGVTGLLVPPGDIAAWVIALEQLDVPRLHEMGLHARARYEARFSAPAFRATMQELLTDWLDRERPVRTPG